MLQRKYSPRRGEPRQQLRAGDALRNIVVGPGLETGEDLVFRIMRGTQHDVDVPGVLRIVADPARELEPVHAGHVPIHDHDGRELALELDERLGAIAGGCHLEAAGGDQVLEAFDDDLVVVDQQHARRDRHQHGLNLRDGRFIGGCIEHGFDVGHEFKTPNASCELLSPSRITIASHVNVVSVRGISAPSQKARLRTIMQTTKGFHHSTLD